MRSALLYMSLCASTAFAADGASTPSVQPPKARVEVVEDTLHGQKIDDPYRWLEDGNAAETQQWTRDQLAYTRNVLDAEPIREKLRARLTPLLQTGELHPPKIAGNWFFYTRRQGNQNQPILYVREGVSGRDRVLVDPNTMSSEGVVALDWWHLSKDGKYVAFGTSPGGSEISTLQVIETATGKLLDEKIDRCRFADVEFLPDNSAFYYTKYPRPGDVPAGQEAYNRHVFFHKIGTNPDGRQDPLIFGEGRSPQELPSLNLSDDGRWLVVKADVTFDRTDLFIKDLQKPDSKFETIIAGQNYMYDVEFADDDVIIHTNESAPKYRVFRVPAASAARANWKEIIPQNSAVLKSLKIVGGKILTEYETAGVSSLRLFDVNGKQLRQPTMPGVGQIENLGGGARSQLAFYSFETFVSPEAIFSYDLNTGKTTEWAKLPAPLDPSQFETKQVMYPSKDGTKVPMFLVYRKGLKLNGANPTLLAGYGGFNISRKPTFYGWLQLWLEHGGVYADAGLRGGSEYGEHWHHDGMLDRKQNVFDDFIAAGEYLIAQKYTDRDHLAIYGRSNGGLLTGAVLTQRPDLFRAVICGVPLIDMLRYQNFQIARLWIPEYGTAEDAKQFPFIYAYSPYQRVKEKTQYPATLIFTSDGDTRVDPLHARKFTARLQAAATNGADRPILLRIEPKAGHGAGKPISKQVEEWADIMTFLFWQLGVK
jgi:prolyl oligopeptidase